MIIDGRLSETYKNAKKIIEGIMEEDGYEYPYITEVSVGRFTSYLGRCSTRYNGGRILDSEIKISYVMLMENITEENRLNTMIHEILHAYFPKDHHGGRWERYARIINRKTGINIQRLATEEETEEFEKNINYKYIVKCGKCGHEWKYMRMCNVVKHAEKCKCGKCNEPLQRIK